MTPLGTERRERRLDHRVAPNASHDTQPRHPYNADMFAPQTLPTTASPLCRPADPAVANGATLHFPGCVAIRLTAEQYDAGKRHIEFWDARAEMAWVVPVTTAVHEYPGCSLAMLASRIAGERGRAVGCYGTLTLERRDDTGERQYAMEPDQCVYLHPERARMLERKSVVVGEDEFPDVVLETDHTTDVRGGKLALYQAWGVPELWVEVPDRRQRFPSGMRPGLTIHLLVGSFYRTAAASRAFPGWTAEDIHQALNETALSEQTAAVLRRVGRVLGEREGTGPDDDPLLREHRAEGRAEGQRTLLRQLAARRFGPETAAALAGWLSGIDDAALLAEAGDWIMDCATGAELRRRIARTRP